MLIIEYRYWILLPLSFIEGPIVAFIAGTLSAAGYFNPFALAIFFFIRDVSVDTLCYLLGYWGAQWRVTKRILHKMHITSEHMREVQALWNKHPGKTMFFSKLSYGIAAGFIVVAGMVEMPFTVFIRYGVIITVCHYILLLALGYFFGAAFGGTITAILENAPYVLAVLGILAILYYFFKKSINKRLKKLEREVDLDL